MVLSWFPEPPNDPEIDFSISATEFLGPGPESSDSEDDPPPIGYDGFEPPPESEWATHGNMYNLVPNVSTVPTKCVLWRSSVCRKWSC